NLRLGDTITGRLDRLAYLWEIDALRLVFNVDGIRAKISPRSNDAWQHPERQLDAHNARAAMHILDRNTHCCRAEGVSGRTDALGDMHDLRPHRVVVDVGNLGGRVDASAGDAWNRRKCLLDRGRTVLAGHAADAQFDVLQSLADNSSLDIMSWRY